MPVTLYHNPRCSKSREALRLLRGRPIAVNGNRAALGRPPEKMPEIL